MKIKNPTLSNKSKLKHSPDRIIKCKSKNKKFNPLQYLNALIQLTNQNNILKCHKKSRPLNIKRDLNSALTSGTPIHDKTIQSSTKIRCKSSLSQQNKIKSNIKGLKNILKIDLENVITQEKDNIIKFTQQQSQEDKYHYQETTYNNLKEKQKHKSQINKINLPYNNNNNNNNNNNDKQTIGNKITKYKQQSLIQIKRFKNKNTDLNYFAIKIQRAWRSYQTYKMVHKYYKYFKRIKKQSNSINHKSSYQKLKIHNNHNEQSLEPNNNYMNHLNNYYCQMPLTNHFKIKQNNYQPNNQIFNKTLKIKINIKKQQQKNNRQRKRLQVYNQFEQDLNLTQKLHQIQQYVQRQSIQSQIYELFSKNRLSIAENPTIQIKKTNKSTINNNKFNKNTICYNETNQQQMRIKQNCGQKSFDLLSNQFNSNSDQKFATIIQQQTQRYDQILNLIQHCSKKKMSQQQVLLSLLNKFQQNKTILQKDFPKTQNKNSIKNNDIQHLVNLDDIIKLGFSPISPPSKQIKQNQNIFIKNNNINIQFTAQNSSQLEQSLKLKSILKQKQQITQLIDSVNVNKPKQKKYKKLSILNKQKQKQQQKQKQKQKQQQKQELNQISRVLLLNDQIQSSNIIEFNSKQIIHIDSIDSGNSDIKLFDMNGFTSNKNIKQQQQYFNMKSNQYLDSLSPKKRISNQSEQNLLSNDSSIKKMIQFSQKLQKQSIKLNKFILSSEQKLLSSTQNKQLNDNQFYAQIQKVNINYFYNSDEDISEKSSIYSFNQNQYEQQNIYKLFQKRIQHLQYQKKLSLQKVTQFNYTKNQQSKKSNEKVKQIQGKFKKEKLKIQNNKKKYFQALKNVKKQALHFQRSMISLSAKKQQQRTQKKLLLVRKSFSAQSIVIKCILAQPLLNEFNITEQIEPKNKILQQKKSLILQQSPQNKYKDQSSSSDQSQIFIQHQQIQNLSRSKISFSQSKPLDSLQLQLRKCSEQLQKIIQYQLINQILQQIYLSQSILKSFKPFIEQVFEFAPIIDSTVKIFLKSLDKFYPSQQQLLHKINQKINPNSIQILRLIRDYDFEIDEYDLILQEDVFKCARKSIQEQYKQKIMVRKDKKMVPNTDIQNSHLVQKMYERQTQKLKKIQKYLNYERDLKIMYMKSVFNCLNEFLIEQKSISTHMYNRSTIGTGELTLSIKQFNYPCDQKDLLIFFTSSFNRIQKILHNKCMLPSFKNHHEIELFQRQMLKMIKLQLQQTQYKWVNYMDEVIQIWNQISNQIIEQILKQTVIDIQLVHK